MCSSVALARLQGSAVSGRCRELVVDIFSKVRFGEAKRYVSLPCLATMGPRSKAGNSLKWISLLRNPHCCRKKQLASSKVVRCAQVALPPWSRPGPSAPQATRGRVWPFTPRQGQGGMLWRRGVERCAQSLPKSRYHGPASRLSGGLA